MPVWVLEVASFVARYPGTTPDSVLNMSLDSYDWMPIASDAFARAAEMKAARDDGRARFKRHGPRS
jgi:hypothetical protein